MRDGSGLPASSGRRTLLVAGASYLALSLFYTYPLVLAPGRAHRFDSPDALLSAWTLSWDLHQLGTKPLSLFEANIFFPERGALAYAENLLTAALLLAPLRLATDNPILLLNAALLLALAASGLATFALARLLGASTAGAGLAGVLFAFAPFRWAHIPHLQMQLAFPLPAAFYFARRLTEGAGKKASLGLGLSIAAAFGSSGYYAVYLLTAIPLFLAFDLLLSSREERRKAARGLALGAALGLLLSFPIVAPYVAKLEEGSRRSLEEAAGFSAVARDYLSSFSRIHFFLPRSPEPLFPGFIAIGLAGLALARSPGTASHRRANGNSGARAPEQRKSEWILAAIGLLGVGISFGPSLGLFSVLYRLLPAYQGLRVPSRAAVLFLLAVALLAGLGLSRVRKAALRPVLLALAAAECYAGPLPWSFRPPSRPPIYQSVAGLGEPGAMVELPLPHPDRFQENAIYVYRSIFHWRPLVNGYSGFVPDSYREAHRLLSEAGWDEALFHLRAKGVRFLLAHTGRLGPRTRRKIAESEQAGLLRLLAESGEDRLYQIEAGRPAGDWR